MRDFFINSLEMLINILVILLIVGVVILAGVVLFDSFNGGLFPALAVLLGGGIYIVLTGGLLYLFLGIYQNTKKTAELLAERAL